MERRVRHFLRIDKCMDKTAPLVGPKDWAWWDGHVIKKAKTHIQKLHKLVSGDLVKPSLEDAMNLDDPQEFVRAENNTPMVVGSDPDTGEQLTISNTVTTFTDIMVMTFSKVGLAGYDSNHFLCRDTSALGDTLNAPKTFSGSKISSTNFASMRTTQSGTTLTYWISTKL